MAIDSGFLAISTRDFLWFVDQTLDEMVSILRKLGDDKANRKPALKGANSPYAILTHCLGVMEYWGGFVVAGRAIERDREAEFRAQGAVEDLAKKVAESRGLLVEDLKMTSPLEPPRVKLDGEYSHLPTARTQGGALVHIYEELSQHLGQMEITRDLLLAQPD